MNSNDNNMFIRENVFNARMDALTSTIRLESERIRNELNSKIDNYQSHNDYLLSDIRSETKVLSTRMDGLEYRINDLQNSISWSFALYAAFIAFAPSIWTFIRKKRQQGLSRQNVKSIV